jgi:hypothetical protein
MLEVAEADLELGFVHPQVNLADAIRPVRMDFEAIEITNHQ